jgi:ABC-type Co2+ transport system permease subunit
VTGWQRAGLIGAMVVIALRLLGLIAAPLGRGLGYCVMPAAESVVYGCVGALAAYWMSQVRTKGAAAVGGAWAAVIAAVIGGVGSIAVNVLAILALGPIRAAALRSQLLPELLIGSGGSALVTFAVGAAYFAIWVIVAAALGALGGLVFAAVKPRKEMA